MPPKQLPLSPIATMNLAQKCLSLAHAQTLLSLVAMVLLGGCAGGPSGHGTFREVQFQAPSSPDPELAPYLEDVEKIGVLTTTNIEPIRELDVEKVMGRLGDAAANRLRNIPKKTIIGQDEIRWQFKDAVFDSTLLDDKEKHQILRQQMELDAVVFIELASLKAQMTPMSPGPYGGLTPNPGLDMTVDLNLTLINLLTGKTWTRPGTQRQWQPVQLQVLGGGGDQTERQLLSALAKPLSQFLERIAPPPTQQVRHFELSGE